MYVSYVRYVLHGSGESNLDSGTVCASIMIIPVGPPSPSSGAATLLLHGSRHVRLLAMQRHEQALIVRRRLLQCFAVRIWRYGQLGNAVDGAFEEFTVQGGVFETLVVGGDDC